MIPAVDNAVAAEFPVGGALVKVAAVGLENSAVPANAVDGLIRPVPDEAALVAGLPVGEVCIFVHGAAGVAHGVGILAADEGLAGILFQPLFDFTHRRVHAAFHVAGVRIAAIPEDALIVYQAAAVQLMEAAAHAVDDRAAVGLVAAGPDQDAGMVLVTLVDGLHPV